MTRTGVICGSPEPGCAVGHEKNGRPSKKHPVGLWTTARDMLRFIEANLGDMKMPPDLMHAIVMTHEELFRATPDHAVGMGWEERQRGRALLISKDGLDSGFASWVGFQPKQDRGIAILKNGGTEGEPTDLGQQLLALAGSPE